MFYLCLIQESELSGRQGLSHKSALEFSLKEFLVILLLCCIVLLRSLWLILL
jgi:hypothetical protein